MQATEDGEEVVVAGGGVGNAAVAEQQREDTGESGDHDQDGGDFAKECGGGWTVVRRVGGLDDEGDEGLPGAKILDGEERAPGDQREHGGGQREVEQGDEGDGEQDGAGMVRAGSRTSAPRKVML